MDDQNQDVHLTEISVDFIERRPASDLKLVFKDDAGVKYKSNKFEHGARVLWNPDIHVRTHSATLTIQRALFKFFKIRVAVISVEFKPDEFGDDKVVRLEDSNRRVAVTFVCGIPKSLGDVTGVLGSQATFPNNVAPVNTQQPHRQIPSIQFRVLIIGRANAGKTSILQRICETTESPVIYRGTEKVTLNPSMDRGEHRIDDELVFSDHTGYVFHDSRGIESGSTEELEILLEFIRRKCRERRLRDRLHAIWYCVPMDNQRPQLDLKYFKDICPDRNVPVVVVFTKYDQFWRNVQIYVEDFGSPDDDVSEVAEKQFQEYYLHSLGDDVRFVRLEKMHRQNTRCDNLIETTAAALNSDIVGLMLLAVQRGNLMWSVKAALKRVRSHNVMKVDHIVRECLFAFPYIWFIFSEEYLNDQDPDSARLEYLADVLLLSLHFSGEQKKSFHRFAGQVMSLATIKNLSATKFGGYHLIIAVVLILKHATSLRLSNMSPESILTHAEVDYRDANIDSKIRRYLTAPSRQHSDELFADFIMAADVTCTHRGVPGDGGR